MPVPAREIIRSAGIAALAWRMFSYGYKRYVRPSLPATTRLLLAGIRVAPRRRLGDRLITPWLYMPPLLDVSDYEQALITALHREVRPGDRVIVVGGGVGVTSVVAAKQVGLTGKVICFEGDSQGAETVRETARINGVGHKLEVRCAIVGPDIAVYGNNHSTTTVAPTELEECDVLELDCEGSEVEILQQLRIRPRVIAVETHGVYGAPSTEVRALLQGLGYEVEDLGPAEPSLLEKCLVEDVIVLVGRRTVQDTQH